MSTLKTFISIYKVPSQPSLLQAKKAQLLQPFLVEEILQSPHHLSVLNALSSAGFFYMH